MIDLRKNLSDYEVYQEGEAKKLLDATWDRTWGYSSTTTSSSTTRSSSYDIWMRDTYGIYVEDRTRILTIQEPSRVAPSAPLPSPPEKVSLGKRLTCFLKGFKNIAP